MHKVVRRWVVRCDSTPSRSGFRSRQAPYCVVFRGNGVTTTFRLRDRFEPSRVQIEADGKPTPVTEDTERHWFTVNPAPREAADIKLEYRSILG
jgi:hypothetical protein